MPGAISLAAGLVLNSTLSGNQAGPNGKGSAWYQVSNSTGFTYVTIANNQAKSGAVKVQ